MVCFQQRCQPDLRVLLLFFVGSGGCCWKLLPAAGGFFSAPGKATEEQLQVKTAQLDAAAVSIPASQEWQV